MNTTLTSTSSETASTSLTQPLSPKKILRGIFSLCGLIGPGAIFIAGLFHLSQTHPRFAWFQTPSEWHWELWGIGIFGTIATIGGVLDWAYHRWGDNYKTCEGEREQSRDEPPEGLRADAGSGHGAEERAAHGD